MGLFFYIVDYLRNTTAINNPIIKGIKRGNRYFITIYPSPSITTTYITFNINAFLFLNSFTQTFLG